MHSYYKQLNWPLSSYMCVDFSLSAIPPHSQCSHSLASLFTHHSSLSLLPCTLIPTPYHSPLTLHPSLLTLIPHSHPSLSSPLLALIPHSHLHSSPSLLTLTPHPLLCQQSQRYGHVQPGQSTSTFQQRISTWHHLRRSQQAAGHARTLAGPQHLLPSARVKCALLVHPVHSHRIATVLRIAEMCDEPTGVTAVLKCIQCLSK